MVSITFFALGMIDLIAGSILFFSTPTILPEISKFVGLVLIGKGIWTIIASLSGL